MVVKDNHRTLRCKIERFFASPTLFEPTLSLARTYGKGHGRLEERHLVASGDVPVGYAAMSPWVTWTSHTSGRSSA